MTDNGLGRVQPRRNEPESPYAFRELLKDVPLTSAEEEDAQPYITCVDYWESNLYIGGSNGELLHFVSIPGENESDPPTFILASRLEPPFTPLQAGGELLGVQQILLLPSVKKACVVCNGTYSFYTLPELSPAYGGKIKQGDCNWVGGLDENRIYEEDESAIILICLKQRIRIIRIGEQAKRIRDIELPGCLNVRRRGDLACIADENSYSLIDVVNQRKIDLFPVSSAPVAISRSSSPAPRPRPLQDDAKSRPLSIHFPNTGGSASPIRPDVRGHARISSLGAQPRDTGRLNPDSPRRWPSRASSQQPDSAPQSPARSRSPLARKQDENQDDPTPLPDAEPESPPPPAEPLRPLILSPSPNEFLLLTGTNQLDPGVGMFVNQDGDVSRGTLEFSSYPSAFILDGSNRDAETPGGTAQNGDSQIIALVRRQASDEMMLETQALDSDPNSRAYLNLPADEAHISKGRPGLCQSMSENTISTPSVVLKLGLRRLYVNTASESGRQEDEAKAKQEDQLIARFAITTTRSVLFVKQSLYWLVRHPILLKLDARLDAALKATATNALLTVQRAEVEYVFNSLRGREPGDEIQFMTFNYIRQKAATLLLLDLMVKTVHGAGASQRDLLYTQEALQSSDIEPRVVLSIIPVLQDEVTESKSGIWIPGGLRSLIEQIQSSTQLSQLQHDSATSYNNLLPLLKSYLLSWRKKKGFGSIADETQVFKTVDAALLHVLLLLDSRSPPGPAAAGSVRAELNDVVDNGVDCFDRAVVLVEAFHRLYILSRLYQNQKKAPLVLSTWRRILDGANDLGGELVDGETDIRKYLTRIKDTSLVREYGSWLANRNPPLGVQIFADDSCRVKFSPAEAVALLKEKAPNAVQHFLEHLVFAKKQPQYSADLISFYLSSLLHTLSTSAAARDALSTTIEVYRALPSPKPSFLSFTRDNAPREEWHAHRLRLLQLLASTTRLDLPALTAQIQPYADLLVPETILLSSRASDHSAALTGLVHGLADHDTAVRYCLRSGRDVFPGPNSSSLTSSSSSSSALAAPSSLNATQRTLFSILLDQYLAALPVAAAGSKTQTQTEQRLPLASELLARFGAWFDAPAVLAKLPDDWPVREVEAFLATAVRGLVKERRETGILRALAAGENLGVGVEVADRTAGHVVQDSGEVGGAAAAGFPSAAGAGKSWADSGYGSLGDGLRQQH